MKLANNELNAIFILGIKRRSGTNFLSDLVCRHPDCIANTIKEDYALNNAPHLIEYADKFYSDFPRLFRVRASKKDLLYKSLGMGVLHYFHENMANTSNLYNARKAEGGAVKIVTKTPSVRNLDCFPRLFPGLPLLIVVRDGRDVVESNVKSFDYDYSAEMHDWANSAQTILQFVEAMGESGHPYMLIKYEELFGDTQEMMEQILRFLNLDREQYDVSSVDNLPIRGSSELRRQGRLHWKPVEKTADFNPIGRWSNWPSDRIAEFDRIAGRQMEALGY